MQRLGSSVKPVRALLVIDCQNDFVPSEDGSLAVPDAEAIIPVINKLRSKEFDFVYLCLDWHPYNHCSFRTNNPGADLFECVHLPTTGSAQIMWPDHCVQGTHGAELHKDLKVEVSDIFTYAGCNPQRDSYSVFKDNGSSVLTEMRDLLEENGVTEIYAVGLATDYCVQYTLLDAKSLLQGVEVFYIEDGCRGISPQGVKNAVDAFKSEKVHIIKSEGSQIGNIPNRRLRIDGTLEITKRNDRVALFVEVDRVYEAVIFRTATGTAWENDVANLVRSSIVNQLCSWSGKNVLHACCEMGDVDTLRQVLLIAGKSLNLSVRTRRDENALMLAIQGKEPKHRTKVVQTLLEYADDNQLRELIFSQSLQFNLSALMFACRDGLPEVVETLLKYDAKSSLQLRSAFGKTPIMYACMTNTTEHATVIELLLRSQPKVEDRIALLQETDKERWNSLHFSAKSGCFARVDWSRALEGYENTSRLPINAKTHSGITFLHLAAFNGRFEVIRSLLDSCDPNRKRKLMDAILKKGLRHRVKVNVKIKGTDNVELDLAIQRRHLECARLLLRLGCHAGSSSPEQMQELLHRLVLMGDVEACESILNFADENRITIDDALVETTQRIEHPETCTVSFANRTDPVGQYLYKCKICQTCVCLVCKDRCHGPGSCRSNYSKLDFEHFPDKDWEPCGVVVSQCDCNRDTCCATAATDIREIEGYRFIPHPVRTSQVRLTAEFFRLSQSIARNMHNVWAKNLSLQGWRYGRDKDVEERLHPHLLPFDSLSIEGAKYNMDMSVETLKVILSLGYELVREVEVPSFERSQLSISTEPSSPPTLMKAVSLMTPGPDKRSRLKMATTSDLHAGAAKYAEFAWDISRPDCVPLDTSGFLIPHQLDNLIDRIASNSHEVWASEKIRQGWRYAPNRNIRKDLKLNASLVPYYVLTSEEKNQLREGAIETIKVILMSGWIIRRPENFHDSDDEATSPASPDPNISQGRRDRRFSTAMMPLRRRDTTQPAKMTLAFRQLKHIRRKLFNQFLFAAVRRGQIESVNILLSKRSSMHVGANLNAIDEFGHTPLYIAIKRGHVATAQRLLTLGANIELRDINGLTPLSLCAYLGNLKLCQVLIQHQARILVCDAMGFTPLHHAANQGHVEVCKYITERLQQEHQSNDIVDLNADMVDYASLGGVIEKVSMEDSSSYLDHTSPAHLKRNATTARESAQSKWRVFRIMFRSRGLGSERSRAARIIPAENLTNSQQLWTPSLAAQGSNVQRMPIHQGTQGSDLGELSLSDRGNPDDGTYHTDGLGVGPSKAAMQVIQKPSMRNFTPDPTPEPGMALSMYPPMSLAVQSDNIEIVELLIKHGSNPMLADGPADRSAMLSPYIRALLRHIEMSAKVEYLQDRIAKRALYEMQKAQTMRSASRRGPNNGQMQENGHLGTVRISMSSILHGMDTFRNEGNGMENDPPSLDSVEPHPKRKNTNTIMSQPISTPKSTAIMSRPLSLRRRLGLVKRIDTHIGNLFGFANQVGGANVANVGDDVIAESADEESAGRASSQINSTRELDQLLEKAQRDKDRAAQMVEAMSKSSKVSAWRRRTAIKMCVRETSLMLLLIISFGCLVQLSPDYNMAAEGTWAIQLETYFENSTADVDGPDDFMGWIRDEFISKDLMRSENYTRLRNSNFVFGAISLKMYDLNALEYTTEYYQSSTSSDSKIESTSLPSNYMSLLLPQANPEDMVTVFDEGTVNWTSPGVYVISMELNLYNPFYEVYGIVEVQQTSTFIGLSSLSMDVKPFRLEYGRFPPSRTFQIAVFVMVVLFTITKVRSWLRSQHRSRRRRREEWMIEILLIGILLFDVYVYESTKNVIMDLRNSVDEYMDLTGAQRLLEIERRFFAVYFLLSVLPLLKATQTIPSIGPVVVALLSTMTDTAVLIYLLVICTACFLLTLTFHVGFGISVTEFSTMISTFENLFLTPFVETWNGITHTGHSSYLGAVLYVFYILFATVSLNLLIAIVTDVYPSARSASDREWEEIITGGIEDNLRDHLHSKNISSTDLRIETWSEAKLLLGRDGRKHWSKTKAEESNEDPAELAKNGACTKSTSEKLVDLSEQIKQLTSIVESLRSEIVTLK